MEDKDILSVESQYGVEQIDSLEGLEAVRKRPGMYIGSTSQRGVTHLVFEVADNCFDEFMAGFGDIVEIHIAKDSTVTVSDYARGIPVGPHPKWKNEDGTPQDTLTGILTRLHAGGKFNQEGSGYKVSGGLHGVGTKAVNGLSDSLIATVKRDGKIYQQKFSKGKPLTKAPEVIGTCDKKETGTTISYHPDPSIFRLTLEPNCKDLQSRLDELASLNGGIKIHYKNDITNIDKTFHYTDGIIGYTKRMVENVKLLYDNPFYMKGSYQLDKNKIILVEASFIHDDEEKPNEVIKTFANNINTYEGGFHLKGFREEYKNQVNKFGIDNKLIAEPIELKYLLDGIYAVVSVKVPEAEFEGQTKTKLGNAEVETAVEEVMRSGFEQFVKNKEFMTILEAVVTRANKVKEAEEAARRARASARKAGTVSKMALPGKLADCSNRSGYTEIFLVEGDSAAGSAKQGRYREFQAILPLFGKIQNTEKTDFDKMMDSEKIQNVIAALGAGVGPKFDINKMRYDKVILMADADDDGSHIRALLITFFYNHMRPLIEEGRIFIACPPLFKVSKGKQDIYLKDEHELKEYKAKNGKTEAQRFKGLGEMNPAQLKETTMDPSTRTLKVVTMEDAEKAKEVFDICMGSRADLRREFIEANAYRVNLNFI